MCVLGAACPVDTTLKLGHAAWLRHFKSPLYLTEKPFYQERPVHDDESESEDEEEEPIDDGRVR